MGGLGEARMKYMLDTNICIHLIQRQPPKLVARLELLHVGDAVLSTIVLAELQHGVERNPSTRDQAQRALDNLLTLFPVLPFDEAAARSYGRLRAAVPDRRRDALDRLIAAHALSRGLVLLTNNTADFQGYPGLMLENWMVET